MTTNFICKYRDCKIIFADIINTFFVLATKKYLQQMQNISQICKCVCYKQRNLTIKFCDLFYVYSKFFLSVIYNFSLFKQSITAINNHIWSELSKYPQVDNKYVGIFLKCVDTLVQKCGLCWENIFYEKVNNEYFFNIFCTYKFSIFRFNVKTFISFVILTLCFSTQSTLCDAEHTHLPINIFYIYTIYIYTYISFCVNAKIPQLHDGNARMTQLLYPLQKQRFTVK